MSFGALPLAAWDFLLNKRKQYQSYRPFTAKVKSIRKSLGKNVAVLDTTFVRKEIGINVYANLDHKTVYPLSAAQHGVARSPD